MTGTASILTEYSSTAEQQQHFINRLSNWAFGCNDTIYKDCTLIDISECGGALLIAKNLVIPNNIFDLTIHAPDNCNIATTTIRAKLRWSDIDYSEAYIKIGFEFEKKSPARQRVIQYLINHSKMEDETAFKCSLIF